MRIAKLVNEWDRLRDGARSWPPQCCRACGHVTLFQEMKSRGLDLILYFKETLFPWDKPETCHHYRQSRVVVPEMVHHLSILPHYPEPRSCDFCETPAEVTMAEGSHLGHWVSFFAIHSCGLPPCPGWGTDTGFLCRISKCSPPQSHSPDMTSGLVKTIILQKFFLSIGPVVSLL